MCVSLSSYRAADPLGFGPPLISTSLPPQGRPYGGFSIGVSGDKSVPSTLAFRRHWQSGRANCVQPAVPVKDPLQRAGLPSLSMTETSSPSPRLTDSCAAACRGRTAAPAPQQRSGTRPLTECRPPSRERASRCRRGSPVRGEGVSSGGISGPRPGPRHTDTSASRVSRTGVGVAASAHRLSVPTGPPVRAPTRAAPEEPGRGLPGTGGSAGG